MPNCWVNYTYDSHWALEVMPAHDREKLYFYFAHRAWSQCATVSTDTQKQQLHQQTNWKESISYILTSELGARTHFFPLFLIDM